MSTVDKPFADNVIKHGGWYNGDSDNSFGDNPRCVEITEYDSVYGGVGYGMTFEGQRNCYVESEFVRNPRCYWSVEMTDKPYSEMTDEPTKKQLNELADAYASTAKLHQDNSVASAVAYALRLAANLPSEKELTGIIDVEDRTNGEAAALILERIRSVK